MSKANKFILGLILFFCYVPKNYGQDCTFKLTGYFLYIKDQDIYSIDGDVGALSHYGIYYIGEDMSISILDLAKQNNKNEIDSSFITLNKVGAISKVKELTFAYNYVLNNCLNGREKLLNVPNAFTEALKIQNYCKSSTIEGKYIAVLYGTLEVLDLSQHITSITNKTYLYFPNMPEDKLELLFSIIFPVRERIYNDREVFSPRGR